MQTPNVQFESCLAKQIFIYFRSKYLILGKNRSIKIGKFLNLENAYLIFLRYVGMRKQKYFNLQETKCMGLSLLPVCSLVQPSLDYQSAVWLVFCGAMYIKNPLPGSV